MKNKVIFVTGGARSGKSRFAQSIADSMKGRKVFLATAQAWDEEMKARIDKHKKERLPGWDTIEETRNLASVIKRCDRKYEVLLIDCLTMWISNLLVQNSFNESEILEEVRELIKYFKIVDSTIIIVSNEVGSGIVPEHRLSRIFRDVVGKANQEIASRADEVYLVASGLPLKLKGSGE